MKRLDESTVELTDDEQIIGDFFMFLVEERGMTPVEAITYLENIGDKVNTVLTYKFLEYLDVPAERAPEPDGT